MFRKSWVVIVSSVLLSHSLVWASTEEQSVYDVLATDLRGQSGCYEINALNARREFLPDYGCEQTVGYLERQCARGVAEGCLKLASVYSKGLNGGTDQGIYIGLLIEACELGSAAACGPVWKREPLRPAPMFSLNKDKAIKSMNENCDNESPQRCVDLAVAYSDELGVSRDIAKSERMLNNACNANNNKACRYLSRLGEPIFNATFSDDGLDVLSKRCDYQYYLPCAIDLARHYTYAPVVSNSEIDTFLLSHATKISIGALLEKKDFSSLITYLGSIENNDYQVFRDIQFMQTSAARLADFGAALDDFVIAKPKSQWPLLLRASYKLGKNFSVDAVKSGGRTWSAWTRKSSIEFDIKNDISRAQSLSKKSVLPRLLSAQSALLQKNWKSLDTRLNKLPKIAKKHFWYWHLRFEYLAVAVNSDRDQSKLARAFIKAKRKNGTLTKLMRAAEPLDADVVLDLNQIAVTSNWYEKTISREFNFVHWDQACDLVQEYNELYPLNRFGYEASVRCGEHAKTVLNLKLENALPEKAIDSASRSGVSMVSCDYIFRGKNLVESFLGQPPKIGACKLPSGELSTKPEFFNWRVRKLLRDLKIDRALLEMASKPDYIINSVVYGISPDLTRLGITLDIGAVSTSMRSFEVHWVRDIDPNVIDGGLTLPASRSTLLSIFNEGVDAIEKSVIVLKETAIDDEVSGVLTRQLNYKNDVLTATELTKMKVGDKDYLISMKDEPVVIDNNGNAILPQLVLVQPVNHESRHVDRMDAAGSKLALLPNPQETDRRDEKARRERAHKQRLTEYLQKFGREQQLRNNQIIRERVIKKMH